MSLGTTRDSSGGSGLPSRRTLHSSHRNETLCCLRCATFKCHLTQGWKMLETVWEVRSAMCHTVTVWVVIVVLTGSARPQICLGLPEQLVEMGLPL